jgi:SAM-dependent methyltransferase
MAADPRVNESERRRWNGPYWPSVWPKREQLTRAVTPLLLDRLGLKTGQRVLDIGCGAGISSITAAHAVGQHGQVVGADISVPLVEYATRRAKEEGVGSVHFVVADVQQELVGGGPFDVATSQFGVMFFDDPVAAFSNIRSQVVRGGRLGFACWQEAERNPWSARAALSAFVAAPPPPAPGRWVTGPFAFASPELVSSVLIGAGWSDIDHTAHEVTVTVTEDALTDDGQLRFLGVDPERIDEAGRAVEAHLAPLRRHDGRYDAPLAFQIFTAIA